MIQSDYGRTKVSEAKKNIKRLQKILDKFQEYHQSIQQDEQELQHLRKELSVFEDNKEYEYNPNCTVCRSKPWVARIAELKNNIKAIEKVLNKHQTALNKYIMKYHEEDTQDELEQLQEWLDQYDEDKYKSYCKLQKEWDEYDKCANEIEDTNHKILSLQNDKDGLRAKQQQLQTQLQESKDRLSKYQTMVETIDLAQQWDDYDEFVLYHKLLRGRFEKQLDTWKRTFFNLDSKLNLKQQKLNLKKQIDLAQNAFNEHNISHARLQERIETHNRLKEQYFITSKAFENIHRTPDNLSIIQCGNSITL
ncbi:hypothetical protein GUITHDRAFT_135477 [Guillardia theta CCMP2712]|uniref:Uncharacterized protein n=1 Tax=Guillardia theta (strain CCMP2712) TaxID=905079 RepID=L1JQH8_GUITC|nr:hypothetical protein GUITHDRAFT_135477 [Guillardia theta CCMP2712]EKX50333.1 hypothetical protein GUITHDRAFT_135477 [Guillardia theta CCMP2712]|eukprot:XP_005837313.1 hypothetical protein GUITHDRAFT_135477 [Guillardia theta CCMP2712]